MFYDKYINDDFLNVVVPKTFEKIAKEYLIRMNKLGKINPLIEDIGTFLYDNPIEKKNGQFDLVTKSRDGYIVYEVKFTNSKIDDHVVKEEVEQIKNTNLNPINYGFVSKSGFNITYGDYILISIDDIFE